MRHFTACFCLFAFASAPVLAGSAFTALQLLPPEQARNVAAIAGRDGTPEPDRWHFIVFDPKAENGLREIVVVGARKTADRPVSQFAESVTASDVMNSDTMRVDSDAVTKMALQFGVANNVSVSALHFDLRKSGPEAIPLWTVTCLDTSGAELGKLIVSSVRGVVILHPGFAREPDLDPIATLSRATPPPLPDNLSDNRPATANTKKAPPKKRATATPAPTPKAGLLQRMFGPR